MHKKIKRTFYRGADRGLQTDGVYQRSVELGECPLQRRLSRGLLIKLGQRVGCSEILRKAQMQKALLPGFGRNQRVAYCSDSFSGSWIARKVTV